MAFTAFIDFIATTRGTVFMAFILFITFIAMAMHVGDPTLAQGKKRRAVWRPDDGSTWTTPRS